MEILVRVIREDNVNELSTILNSNENYRNNFNTFQARMMNSQRAHFMFMPLLHVAVQQKSQRVVEYLLSQDFVDKNICNAYGENIYHVVCSMRGAEQLFSMIERNVPHHLFLNNSNFRINAFHIACKENNIFIVKRMYEIMETLKVDLTQTKLLAMKYALLGQDFDTIEYVSSIEGVQLNDNLLLQSIRYSTIEIVVHLLNISLRQNIPSHLHNQFHILKFVNNIPNNNKNNNNNDNSRKEKIENNLVLQEEIKEINSKKIQKRVRDHHFDDSLINLNKKIKHSNNNNTNNNENNNIDINDINLHYLIEENFQKIIDINQYGNRIWHVVCFNRNLDVVQLIFSLKGIKPEILNDDGNNIFLIACEKNPNIKVIKYIHKLFPLFFHSQVNNKESIKNAAYFVLDNLVMKRPDKLNILHYLYLNGIDIHLLSKKFHHNQTIYRSIYSTTINFFLLLEEYLKVISQDFDYLQNEHDDEAYRKPSFWKDIDNNINADEQSKRVNEWKNRFDEHVLHHLSKMIQEWMLLKRN